MKLKLAVILLAVLSRLAVAAAAAPRNAKSESSATDQPAGNQPAAAALPAESLESILAAYRALSAAERTTWIKGLYNERFLPAARAARAPDEFAAQDKFWQSAIAYHVAERRLTQRGLEKVLDHLFATEAAALPHAERRYRIAVYNAFRDDKAAYQRRLAAYQRLLADWQQQGSNLAERQLLTQWLTVAATRLHAGQLELLPPRPKFANNTVAALMPGRPIAAQVAEAKAAPTRTPARPAGEQLFEELASAAARESLPPSGPLTGPQPRVYEQPRTKDQATVTATRPRFVEQSLTQPAATAARRHESAQHQPSVPQVALQHPQLGPQRHVTLRLPPSTAAVPVEAAPIEKTLTKVAVATPPAPHKTPVLLPPDVASQQKNAQPQDESPTDVINRIELSARLSGYNLATADLAGRLQDAEAWTLTRLVDAVEELTDLVDRRDALELYWNLLPEQEQRTQRLAPVTPLIALVGAKISHLREKWSADGEQRQLELDTLNRLSKSLAELVPPPAVPHGK